jgi:ABC-2 type transport system ATP-binding protein
MLKFNGITKIFKSDILTQPFVALDDVSFEIPHGSMVGFLGANGAGKTTSIKIIMDFIRADRGEVSFSPDMGATKIDVFKRIGFLPERPYFYQNLTGHEFLDFMGRLSELPSNKIREQVNFWSPRFKIDYALKRELKTYSKGMLQRIGFLATILHSPDLIILDEPLSGLDPIGRKELKDVIVEVHRQGKTVFFSSHIVPDVEEICDRVIFLKEGKLVYDGEVEKLLHTSVELDYEIKFRNENKVIPMTPIVKQISFPGHLHVMTVKEGQRNALMSELVSQKIDVVGVELIKPSLEEIFYKTKGLNADS